MDYPKLFFIYSKYIDNLHYLCNQIEISFLIHTT